MTAHYSSPHTDPAKPFFVEWQQKNYPQGFLGNMGAGPER
jgi:hypothetical protein